MDTAATGRPTHAEPPGRSSDYRPHRCAPPERGTKGMIYDCWCGRRWQAAAGLTIRDNRIVSLCPDWQFVTRLHEMPRRRPLPYRPSPPESRGGPR